MSTDDVAWHHSFFGWTDLLTEGVLRPLHEGRAISYRPPAWQARGRTGSIDVPAGTRWVFVEGASASRRELIGLLDAVVWVQSDAREAERLGIARDVAHGANGDVRATTRFWREWQAEELPFLADQQPWSRADAVVAGVGIDKSHAGTGLDRLLLAPGHLSETST